MDIKGSETHLLPGWGGCPVKTPTEKISNKSQITAESAHTVCSSDKIVPFSIFSQKQQTDVPDVGGKAALTLHTVDLSGS